MKRIIPLVILLAVIGGGYWWFTQSTVTTSEASTALVGSGSIEAETIAITAELGGRIVEISVVEGDEVAAGQVLVGLDKSDLLAQKGQLESALTAAKANLELVSAPPQAEEIALAQARLTQAEVAQGGAKQTWQQAERLAADPHQLEAQTNRARTRVTDAEKNLELAQVNLKRMEIQAEAAGRNQSSHAALVQNEVAQFQLQAAQQGLQMAEVVLAGAKSQVEHLIHLQNRPLALIAQANQTEAVFRQTEAAVLSAEANLAAVKAGPRPEDIAIAQAQVLEAEAALAAVEVQLAKQTLTAPRAGLINQKLINPGELAAPGATLLELNDIDTVDLIVYIPETRIGEVKVGQKARVEVDAYENEAFEGMVTFIAHEAEFTPRNVQTQEERVNLVFAVKITLDNADHRLKPGMPADARILPEMAPQTGQAPTPLPEPQATVTPTTGPAIRGTATSVGPLTLPAAGSSPTAEPTAAPFQAGPSRQAEIVTWGLKVRTGPGVDYPVFAHLTAGQVVTIIKVDAKNGWFQVELPGGEQTGWITNHPAYVLIK